jgi:hypothetical protein
MVFVNVLSICLIKVMRRVWYLVYPKFILPINIQTQNICKSTYDTTSQKEVLKVKRLFLHYFHRTFNEERGVNFPCCVLAHNAHN